MAATKDRFEWQADKKLAKRDEKCGEGVSARGVYWVDAK
jgi:hypothetical protein